MDIRRTCAFAFVLTLASFGMNAAAQVSATATAPAPTATTTSTATATATTTTNPAVPSQVDPAGDLAKLYPQAGSIGLAIAIVPDPSIPRYRRVFDLQIQAITLGMLNDGYVLDRYSFPWSPGSATADPAAYGLLIFRCDGWRGYACQDLSTIASGDVVKFGQTTRVRAIYLVTDTATWGVSTRALTCAARRIREQLLPAPTREPGESCRKPAKDKTEVTTPAPSADKASLLRYPAACDKKDGSKQLVILGPNFSGAMDSIGQLSPKLVDSEINALCLVSSATTERSNPEVVRKYQDVNYVRLAADDGVKLERLSQLAGMFGYFKTEEEEKQEEEERKKREGDDKDKAKTWGDRKFKVVFLAEASTFGYGVCNAGSGTSMAPDAIKRAGIIKKFCRESPTLYFPAAIANIRDGIDQQRERQLTDVETAVKAALASEYLALDTNAENDSEFPENRQSKLTATTQQLALDHVLEQLEQYRPKMVVVVATDVRDRLFLFDQLRQRLPSAMLIDLESDILLAHPDFLHASRGAVTVASANLFVRRGRLYGCEQFGDVDGEKVRVPLASWSLDSQGILAGAVSRLYDTNQTSTVMPCILDLNLEKYGPRAPVLHVVTLKGLRRISRVVDLKPKPESRAEEIAIARETRLRNVYIGQWLSVLCCFAVVLPWLWIRPLRKVNRPVLTMPAWEMTLCAGVAGAVIWSFAMLASYAGEDPESGYALIYWSLAIVSLGVCGLHLCLKRVEEAGQTLKDLPPRHRRAIAAAGLFACVLAAAPPFLTYLLPRAEPAMDCELLMRLGLDIGQGLAYHVVVALGVFTVLAIMIALGTGLCILSRNNDLLGIKTLNADIKRGARSPHFPASAIVGVLFFIGLTAVPSLIGPLGGPRLTVFGPWASLVATVVLVVTTLGATIFTVIAVHSSRRIRVISAHVGRCVAPPLTPGRTEPVGEYPGLWPASEWQPDLFAATPIVVRVGSDVIAPLTGKTELNWKTLVNEFLGKGPNGKVIDRIDDGEHRRAMFALIASEVSLYRWFVIGSVLCAVASVCAAYLFPLEADALLMWNLMVLVVHAFLAGYVATSFERDGVLSNILCNRPKKATFSATLFTYAALPFFALGFAIAVSQVPGVVDWGGGLLALLSAIGIGP